MKLLDFLNTQALRAGLPSDHADLKTLLSTAALAEIDVPDPVATAFRNLMTEAEAKNNTTLKNHYVAQVLSGIDGSLSERVTGQLAELLPASVIEQFNAEKATGKKISLLLDELTKVKAKPASDPNKEEQIRQLNEKITNLTKQKDDEVKAERAKLLDYRRDLVMKQAQTGIKWADYYPEHLRGTLASQAVQAEMEKKGVVLVFDEATDSFKLKQKASPELDYIVDGKPLSLDALTLQVAAENKFIAVAAGGGSPGTKTPVQPPAGGGSNHQPARSAGFNAAVDSSLADGMRNIGED